MRRSVCLHTTKWRHRNSWRVQWNSICFDFKCPFLYRFRFRGTFAIIMSVTIDYDYLFKFLTLGDSCVGKTSFLYQYTDGVFNSKFSSTVGIDFREKRMVCATHFSNFKFDSLNKKKISISNADKKLYNSKGRNFRVHMQLWDTSGQERYERISLCNLNDFLESFLSFRAKVSKSHNGFLSWRSWIFVDFRSDEWAVISWDCLLDGSTKGKEKYNLIDKIDKQFLQLNK